MGNPGESITVVHTGALGDCVLLWPMLRSMVARGGRVTLVTHDSKGALAARELGVRAESIENSTWREMWNGEVRQRASAQGERPISGDPHRVVSFIADGVNGVWVGNARARFPGAAIELVERRLDRTLAIELAHREGGAGVLVPLRTNPRGAAVLHVGAGSRAKRWGMERWEALARRLEAPLRVIAGEVEAERFSAAESAAFKRLDGEFLDDLRLLADEIARARIFVGCDSGPSHLAAQLGVPTVSVFLATDPVMWAPIGPAVRALGGIGDDVTVDDVASACLTRWPAD